MNNPKDVKFEDLDKLLRHHGFMCRKPSGGSSHYNYYHLDLPDVLTVPYNRPIKAIYVKKQFNNLKSGVNKLKSLNYYLNLNYPIKLKQLSEEDGGG